MAKDKKKGLLDKAIDAVSSRDEKEAAKEAEREATAAKAKASRVTQEKRAAEAKAKAAEGRAKAAEKKAAEAEAKASRLQREKVSDMRQEARRKAAEKRTEARTYVVKSGDSLSKIAKELLGDANRWPEIFEANKDQIKDPNLIHPGQELRIP